jgi:DNA-3-methyladenine glycosylase II
MSSTEAEHLAEARAWLEKKDKKLARVIKDVGICRLEIDAMQSVYQALAQSIVYQQLTGKAAATIFGRVMTLAGKPAILAPDDILAAGEEKLRSLGCSRAKALALLDLSLKTKMGEIPDLVAMESMSDDELISHISSVRGIGRWTVEMLMIFRLGRMDVMPATDYGIRKGFALTYKLIDLPAPKEILSHSEKWKPFRSVASWYLWRSLDPVKPMPQESK